MSSRSSSLPPSPWHDWHNAAIYQSYIEDFPIYRWLNRHLASLSCLESAQRILDLACGTGATTLGCLPHMARDSELVGIDSSLPMVEIARAEVRDPRCRFQVGDARELSEHLDEKFDRAICNAAFWQLPELGAVLDQLVRVLLPDAYLTFSIPTQQLASDDLSTHPFQVALARGLREEKSSGSLLAPLATARFASSEVLGSLLLSRGFQIDTLVRNVYVGEQGELVDLMQIPAMTASLAPELPVARCRAAISEAAARIDPHQPVSVCWTFVRARRA